MLKLGISCAGYHKVHKSKQIKRARLYHVENADWFCRSKQWPNAIAVLECYVCQLITLMSIFANLNNNFLKYKFINFFSRCEFHTSNSMLPIFNSQFRMHLIIFGNIFNGINALLQNIQSLESCEDET